YFAARTARCNAEKRMKHSFHSRGANDVETLHQNPAGTARAQWSFRMLVLGSLVALLVGATVGLLGGGGATLMLPLLVYGVGLPPPPATAGSLAVVCATSLVGALVHARHGRVDLRVAVAFGSASTGAASLGGLAAGRIPAEILIGLFAFA